jgi:O-antigen/teichoic acid export membrane protein
MVLVFSSLILVFSDLALGAALVQRKVQSNVDRSTVFWFSVTAGGIFTLAGVALSGPVAAFYGDPSVKPLFAVLAAGFVISSLATTQESLLVRDMSFRSLELRMIGATATGAVVGIALAASGFGAWAIIGQQLAISSVSTILVWRASPWKPSFTFSLESLRSLGGFSANVFGQRLLYYLHRNVDNLLVGRYVGAAALGAYSLAYNVMLLPFSRIAGPIQDVLYPALSRLQDDKEAMAAIWFRASRLVGFVTVPALLGLVAVAPDFVSVVLGQRWHTVTPLLQILCWVGLVQSLQTLNSNILQALARTSILLRYSIVFFIAHLIAFGLGLHWGVLGVAAAYAISTAVVEPVYTVLTARALGVSPVRFLAALRGVVEAAVIMAVAVLAMRLALLDAGFGAGLRLPICIAVGLIVYLPICLWRTPQITTEVAALRRQRGGREPALAVPNEGVA